MAELLYASAHLTGDFPNPANAVGNTPATWAGTLNTNTSYTSRWAMSDPADPLTAAATQSVSVVARKGSNSNDPTVTVNLWDNGVFVAQLASAAVSSTTGQTLAGSFNTADVSSGGNVEVEVVQTAAGGSPNARNSAEISHIEWTADTTPQAAPVPEVAAPLTVAVDLAGSLSVPAASVGSVAAPLELAVSLGGSVSPPAATVNSVAAPLAVAVDGGGVLSVPAAAPPNVSAPLTVNVGAAGVLSVPTATVPELVGALTVVVDVPGTAARVTGPPTDPPPLAAYKGLDREKAWAIIPNARRPT